MRERVIEKVLSLTWRESQMCPGNVDPFQFVLWHHYFLGLILQTSSKCQLKMFS